MAHLQIVRSQVYDKNWYFIYEERDKVFIPKLSARKRFIKFRHLEKALSYCFHHPKTDLEVSYIDKKNHIKSHFIKMW